MFRPLFEETLRAFREDDILPAAGGGFVAGNVSRLARGEDLRELFSPGQLGSLLGEDRERFWLSEDITRDRASTLRDFLIHQVGIKELTPDSLSSRLTEEFLNAQPDEWIARLYEFLGGQKSLRLDLLGRQAPIVRCEDGSHVAPFSEGIPMVFLPSSDTTDFRTVKASVCSTAAAKEFLQAIGLNEPDPVDDVIQNILKNYEKEPVRPTEADYEADLQRILAAFKTDSEQGRRKLLEALRKSVFVKAVDAGTGEIKFLKPGLVYRRTNRLAAVFAGIEGVWMVDNQIAGLRGEAARDLLQACGALDVLRTTASGQALSWDEKRALRQKRAASAYTYERFEGDADCIELGSVLAAIETEVANDARERAVQLWALLRDTLRDRRESYFQATYHWSFSKRSWSIDFPAAWVRRLRDANWIPDEHGKFRRPSEICISQVCDEFADLPSAFLTEILGYRAEAIKELAEMEGIDLEALNLLKRHGLSAEGLRKLLEETDESGDTDEDSRGSDGKNDGLAEDETVENETGSSESKGGTGLGGLGKGGHGFGGGKGKQGEAKGTGTQRKNFQTYVGVESDDPEQCEGLSRDERLALEEVAIQFILGGEPNLKRTPTNNPGFDLYEGKSMDSATRYVEVKALRGEWNRPVTMSKTQFQFAEVMHEKYSLYVVEWVGVSAKMRLHRVSDPAGAAKYFCFDEGWREIAGYQELAND